MKIHRLACSLVLTLAAAASASANDYGQVVSSTAGMVGDAQAQKLAQQYGLQVMNVTWEDTGRFKGSSVGPNISDMTIQVQQKDPKTGKHQLTCMPVIRFPNFSDKTGDVPIDSFKLLVGNERGQSLREITLRELLGNLRRYLSDPLSWTANEVSLLAERDTHVLASAQACFLPVPREGFAEFNPVLFNYQSRQGDPAVLTILVTREGTSVTVIDNVRDGFSAGGTWGQRLFFNQNGERASLTGQRLSDFNAGQEATGQAHSDQSPAKRPDDAGGLNQVLLIQVPLKQKQPARTEMIMEDCEMLCEKSAPSAGSNVEEAVIGHGDVEGPFTEVDGLSIERDDRFPIRVTVQFYKATSNGKVNAADMETIAGQIASVYSKAEAVGSLVTQGETGRVTEHTGLKHQPPGWWSAFWKRHRENTGQSPAETQAMLRDLFGAGYVPRDAAQAAQAVKRARILCGVERPTEPPRTGGDEEPSTDTLGGVYDRAESFRTSAPLWLTLGVLALVALPVAGRRRLTDV